ncbi:MAG: glycosyltransferase family 2 protein [Acidobacteriota bacterium]
MKLLIAIPALNEEESIESIIERALAARETIVTGSPVTSVDVTVVSDGSTDRTVEIARRHEGRIKLIVFPENRGYGAAIKEAWARSDADLLGFLDADGTCDPAFFRSLCATLVEKDADVVLGSRLSKDSRMPALRRVGNVIFALMLSFFGNERVRDTASGMRVVRRSSLPRLMPLPDGMHFTPAMSARAILNEEIRIVEIPMTYDERKGESKLRVLRDGLRFLRVIVESAFLYRPSRPLGAIGILLVLAAMALMIMPTRFYLTNSYLLEWMIYRFVVSNLLGASGVLCLCASYLAQSIVDMTLLQRGTARPRRGARFFHSGAFWLVPLALFLAGGLLVLPSFLELLRTGHTYLHWSRFVSMSFMYEVAVILLVTRAVDYVLSLIRAQLTYLARPS